MEFDKDGSKIQRVQKDNYDVIMGDDFIYVKGKATITVDGNFNLKTSTINIEASEINMAADGAVKIKGSTVKIESTGGMDLKAGGSGKFSSGGKLHLKGATAALGGATVDIPAAKVGLQSGSVDSASGTGLKGGGTGASPEEQSEAANTANTAATTTANTAASANAVGTSASTSSAAAGVDPKAAPKETLEEVKITAKKVEVDKGFNLGKIVGGVTATISKVSDSLTQAIDTVTREFNNSPIGELAGKVEELSFAINRTKGEILNLAPDSKFKLLDKIDDLSALAYSKDLDFKIDKQIQNNILNEIYDVTEEKLTTVIGRHVYPKTETIQQDNDAFYEENKEVLERYAAQELDPETDTEIDLTESEANNTLGSEGL